MSTRPRPCAGCRKPTYSARRLCIPCRKRIRDEYEHGLRGGHWAPNSRGVQIWVWDQAVAS